jgi:predicted secreted protein
VPERRRCEDQTRDPETKKERALRALLVLDFRFRGNDVVLMSLKITIGLYFILWWTLLFAVLPFGIKSQHETGEVVPGTDPGAPVAPMMWRKVLWTTLITTIAIVIVYVVVTYKLIAVS